MNYNKVMLAGHLTRDPQLSYTPSQTAVVQFGIATNRKWKAQDGTARDETCFVDLKAFGKTAETVNKFFTKGKPIFIEGHLALDEWTAQDGKKITKLRVIVDQFQFVGEKAGGQPQQAPAGPPQDEEIPF